MKKKIEKYKISKINCILIVSMIVIVLVCIFAMRNKDQLERAYKYDLAFGWLYEDGSPVVISELKKSDVPFTISRTVTMDEQNDEALCFYTKNIYFDVYCNEVKIYGYHPEVPRIFGKAYGVYMHHMELPVYDGEAELSIEIMPIYKDSANFIRDMAFMDGGTFVRKELSGDFIGFVMCLIIFIYGSVLFVMGVRGDRLNERRTEIVSIGAFSIVASAFIVTEVQLLQLFTGNPIIVHFMDYIALMFLSYPAVVYVANATGNKDSIFTTIVGFFTVVNMLVQISLTISGVSDYHQMLHLTHVEILMAVVFIIILIIKGIKNKLIDKRIYIYLVIAFGITALTGGYDVINYIAHSNQSRDGNVFQFGMFAFIMLIGTYEVSSILELMQKGQKAEIMEELAYHDVLTGLWNRQAYMREEYRLRSEKNGIYTFIMFDVNSLKQMNDQFGHSFGDELIKGAAEVIDKSFGERGMCFSMGGDEFFVIYRSSCESKNFEMACEQFARSIDEYNERKKLPFPLSIAYGYDEFNGEKDRPENVERIADDRMYKMKVSMKTAGI